MSEYEDQHGHTHSQMGSVGSDLSRYGGKLQKLDVDASGYVRDPLGNIRGNVYSDAGRPPSSSNASCAGVVGVAVLIVIVAFWLVATIGRH